MTRKVPLRTDIYSGFISNNRGSTDKRPHAETERKFPRASNTNRQPEICISCLSLNLNGDYVSVEDESSLSGSDSRQFQIGKVCCTGVCMILINPTH